MGRAGSQVPSSGGCPAHPAVGLRLGLGSERAGLPGLMHQVMDTLPRAGPTPVPRSPEGKDPIPCPSSQLAPFPRAVAVSGAFGASAPGLSLVPCLLLADDSAGLWLGWACSAHRAAGCSSPRGDAVRAVAAGRPVLAPGWPLARLLPGCGAAGALRLPVRGGRWAPGVHHRGRALPAAAQVQRGLVAGAAAERPPQGPAHLRAGHLRGRGGPWHGEWPVAECHAARSCGHPAVPGPGPAAAVPIPPGPV